FAHSVADRNERFVVLPALLRKQKIVDGKRRSHASSNGRRIHKRCNPDAIASVLLFSSENLCATIAFSWHSSLAALLSCRAGPTARILQAVRILLWKRKIHPFPMTQRIVR